jgi:hypothetical protein
VHLGGALTRLATALPARVPVTTGRDAARHAAQHELSSPAYHQQQGNLVQQAVAWLWARFDELLARAALATPGGWVGLTVCLVLVVALLGGLLWRLGRPTRHRRGNGAPELFAGARRTAAEHRAASQRHAAAQDWDAALQERMRAIVRALEERALLEDRPGRTADEAARAAGAALPGYAAELRAAARRFDDVRYGGRSAAERDYLPLAGLDERLSRTRVTQAPSEPATVSTTPEQRTAAAGLRAKGNSYPTVFPSPDDWAAPGGTAH